MRTATTSPLPFTSYTCDETKVWRFRQTKLTIREAKKLTIRGKFWLALVGLSVLALAGYTLRTSLVARTGTFEADSTAVPPSEEAQISTTVEQALLLVHQVSTIPTAQPDFTQQSAAAFLTRGEKELLTVFSPTCPYYSALVNGLSGLPSASRTVRETGFGISDFQVTSDNVSGNMATVVWQAHVWMDTSGKQAEGAWSPPFTAYNGLTGTATLEQQSNGAWIIVGWTDDFIPGEGP